MQPIRSSTSPRNPRRLDPDADVPVPNLWPCTLQTLALGVALTGVGCDPAIGAGEEEETVTEPGWRKGPPPPPPCPTVWAPVCGDDGVRYSNECRAQRAGAQALDGGALIHISDAHGETMFFWSENHDFIDQAIALEAKPGVGADIPVLALASEPGNCSQPEAFSVDPHDMAWADVTVEVCDADLAYLRDNLDEFLASAGGSWCPWANSVVAVYDHR